MPWRKAVHMLQRTRITPSSGALLSILSLCSDFALEKTRHAAYASDHLGKEFVK